MLYMYLDLNVVRVLRDVGVSCIMLFVVLIGFNRGLIIKEFIQILIDEIDLLIIVDVGIGKFLQVCEVIEMGVIVIMVNIVIVIVNDILRMVRVFKYVI